MESNGTPFSTLLDNESLPGAAPSSRRPIPHSKGTSANPLIDAREFGLRLDSDLTRKMRNKLKERAPNRTQKSFLDPKSLSKSPLAQPDPTISSDIAPYVPELRELITSITSELQDNIHRLMSLNPSRKLGLFRHLTTLAKLPNSETKPSPNELTRELQQWVGGPRSRTQEQAMSIFLEEVAIVFLAQAILLKNWNDRRLRSFQDKDLANLNWTLCNELRSHLPVDRESWQTTRQNLYSWYVPGPDVQKQVWEKIQTWTLENKPASFLSRLMLACRKAVQDVPEQSGFDHSFLKAIWSFLPEIGFDPEGVDPSRPFQRKKIVFCPTIRDGSFFRTMPHEFAANVELTGCENSSFLIMLAELGQLWSRPTSPPLWTRGHGFEVFAREQLSIDSVADSFAAHRTGNAARIAEIESCDLGFISEERRIHSRSKTPEAAELRGNISETPGFSSFKQEGATRGTLQACVAISKLRPGGILVWLRQDPIESNDGMEALRYILDRSVLVAEWDLSSVDHQLTSQSKLFANYVYVFRRELSLEKRNANHPCLIRIGGTLRSHIETPILTSEAFLALSAETPERTQWKVSKRQSPSPQSEWSARWPDRENDSTLRKLEELRKNSIPLGQIASIRMLSRSQRTESNQRVSDHSFILVRGSKRRGDDRLALDVTIKSHGESLADAMGDDKKVKGAIVFNIGDLPLYPIKKYLETETVREWVDFYSQKKKGNWVLKEEVLKFIPVSNLFLSELKSPLRLRNPDAQRLAQSIRENLSEANSYLDLFQEQSIFHQELRMSGFVEASLALRETLPSKDRTKKILNDDGRISWRKFMQILPQQDRISFQLHPEIRLEGSLPAQIPITKIELIESGSPGILVATESGHHLHIGSSSRTMADMLWDQFKDLLSGHPTWNELVDFITLPRDVEASRMTADEILRSYNEVKDRRVELKRFIARTNV